jgi:hypothetical protein
MTKANQQIIPSHVAILVPSVEKAAKYLQKFEFQIGSVDEFDGTREIYVQYGQGNPLLLMEPKGNGSYRRALDKRGPGLHHLAIDVLDLNAYLKSINGSGWLLHLNSIDSIKDYKTAYLARPGFPALIEVQEKETLSYAPLFVEKIDVAFDSKQIGLVQAIGLENLLNRSSENMIQLSGKKINLRDLFL